VTTTPFLLAALALLGVALTYAYRIGVGPTVFDRILGVNAVGTTTAVVLLLTGVVWERLDLFVDVVLAYALLAFVGAIAAARYFERSGQAQ
jgi:multicomponent Na+:H+ antiporter subunit F